MVLALHHKDKNILTLKKAMRHKRFIYIRAILNEEDLNIALDTIKKESKQCEETNFLISFLYVAQFDRPLNNIISPFHAFIGNLEKSEHAKFFILDCHAKKLKNAHIIINIDPTNYLRFLLKRYVSHSTIFINPDQGASAKVKKLSTIFGKPRLSFLKNQQSKNVSILGNDKNLKGKNCIIIDDIINTGATLIETVDYLIKRNIKDFIIYVTHVINENALIYLLNHSQCLNIIVTDSIPLSITHPKLVLLTLCNS